MFADLNKHAIRPSNSISTLYDHREQVSELARYLVKTIPIFTKLTELEKSSISNRSIKLFTISSIKNASKALLRKGSKDSVSDEEMTLAADYWAVVTKCMPDWQAVLERKIASSELREQYVHAHGVILQSLGQIGGDLLSKEPKNWRVVLKKLSKIDWARGNQEWEGRAMVHGRISKARTNVLLTGNYLKQKLGLKLNEIEQLEEDKFNK